MNTAVGGGQAGDEGKGKLVDFLIQEQDHKHVVRFNGLDNAGHTLVLAPGTVSGLESEVSVVTHIVPSGIAHDNVLLYMARGMAINFLQLDHEVREINAKLRRDITQRLRIDANA